MRIHFSGDCFIFRHCSQRWRKWTCGRSHGSYSSKSCFKFFLLGQLTCAIVEVRCHAPLSGLDYSGGFCKVSSDMRVPSSRFLSNLMLDCSIGCQLSLCLCEWVSRRIETNPYRCSAALPLSARVCLTGILSRSCRCPATCWRSLGLPLLRPCRRLASRSEHFWSSHRLPRSWYFDFQAAGTRPCLSGTLLAIFSRHFAAYFVDSGELSDAFAKKDSFFQWIPSDAHLRVLSIVVVRRPICCLICTTLSRLTNTRRLLNVFSS